MAALLEYNIEVVGTRNVERALSSIEARFVQHNAKMGRLLGGRGGAGGGRRGVDPARAAARDAERSAKKVAREEQKLAREQQRQSDYWAKARLSQARLRHREEETAIRKQGRLTERNLRQERIGREQFLRSTVGNSASRIGGVAKAVGGAGLAMTGIGGAALAASSIAQASKLDDMTRRLSIAGRGKGEQGVSPDALRREFTNTGIASGFDPEQVAGGVAAYVAKTGDLDTARKNQRTYATVAQGADADIKEVFEAAADLSDKMNVKSVEDMASAFAILSAQGKKGSFELKAMAAQFPEIFSSAANAGAKGIQGVRDVGATMQLAMRATGNSSEAATAVNAMFRQLAAKAKDMQSGKAFGGRKVQVYEKGDPTKNMNNFAEVAQNAISASRGDISQLNDVFDARGRKALDPLINKYKEAYNKAGGGKKGDTAGREAMKGIFEDFSKVSADFSEVERDAADAMKGFSVQMEIFNTQLKEAVASQLFPEIVKLAPELKQLIPQVKSATQAFVSLIKFFANHPFAGIGGLIATSIAYDIAKAKLGSIVSNALKGALGGATAVTGAAVGGAAVAGGWASKPIKSGGKTTWGGAIGAAGTGLAVGGMLASAIFTAGVVTFENAEVHMKEAGKDLNDARNLGIEDIEKLRQLKQEQIKRVNDAKAPGAADLVGLGDVLNPSRAAEVKTQEAFLQEMSERLNKLEVLKEFGDKIVKAGASQEEAAKRIDEAAKKLGVTLPNRGNSPSPVKP